jgi:glycosyltransferase involved in cell wall biosynthesis
MILTAPPPARRVLPPNLWFDVEDLFIYAATSPRPTGIQRLAFEIYGAIQRSYGDSGRIHFVRHDQVRNSFRTVPWETVAGLFDRLVSAPDAKHRSRFAPSARGIAPEPRSRWLARRVVYRLPPGVRQRLLDAARLQWQAILAFSDLVGFCIAGVIGRGSRIARLMAGRSPRSAQAWSEPTAEFADLAQPGDFVVALGAPWSCPDYAGLIGNARARYGIRFAVLIFDIIPIRRPEWFDSGLARVFRAWFTSVLPAADIVFAISRSTAGDIERFAANHAITLRAPVQTVPIGTGFGAWSTRQAAAAAPALMPSPGSYVLFVSTIEARKNHLLLFRVWRRMLEDMPPAMVPTLVFAGRVGWLVDDLLKQLENTDYLDRKIRLIQNASDLELAELYSGCLFTVFPSHYEGWGLPVTESLAFGKPCLVARSSSLPEAGGRLARYFDPESVSDAYEVIRGVIEDPEALRAWQSEIVREFHPVPWTATGDAIVQCLGAAPSEAPAAMPSRLSHDGVA